MDLDGLNRVGSGLDVRILDQDTDFRFDNTKMHRNQEGAKHLGQPLLKCLNKLTVWYTQLPTTEYSAKQIVVDLRCIQSRGIARESYNVKVAGKLITNLQPFPGLVMNLALPL